MLGYEPTEVSKKEIYKLTAFMKKEKIASAVFGAAWIKDADCEENEVISDMLFFEAGPEKAYDAALLMSLFTKHTKPHEARLVADELSISIPKRLIAKSIICKESKGDKLYERMHKFGQRFPDYVFELMKSREDMQALSRKSVQLKLERLVEASKKLADRSEVEEPFTPTKTIESPTSCLSYASPEEGFTSFSDRPQ